MNVAERGWQQSLPGHAVNQARGRDVVDERRVADGEQCDGGEHDGRNRRRGAGDYFGNRSWRFGKLVPWHHRDGGHRDRDIEERGGRHGEDETERQRPLGMPDFLCNIVHVLEANKGKRRRARQPA